MLAPAYNAEVLRSLQSCPNPTCDSFLCVARGKCCDGRPMLSVWGALHGSSLSTTSPRMLSAKLSSRSPWDRSSEPAFSQDPSQCFIYLVTHVYIMSRTQSCALCYSPCSASRGRSSARVGPGAALGLRAATRVTVAAGVFCLLKNSSCKVKIQVRSGERRACLYHTVISRRLQPYLLT
jgi:hypothetical protein